MYEFKRNSLDDDNIQKKTIKKFDVISQFDKSYV
jgi:hypothetical protein